MFEAAEVGRKVSKKDYKAQEPELHTQLLAVQRLVESTNIPVIIIISGVEGAGKGEVVNCLNTWLDTRGLKTWAFWGESDEEQERPRFWRFWRRLPPRGTIGIMFGSWYTQPIIDLAFERINDAEFDQEMLKISSFERELSDDGALIIKLWFHLSEEAQQARLRKDNKADKKSWKISPLAKQYAKSYDNFARASERAIRLTDAGFASWHIIEAENERYRNLTAGSIILHEMEHRIAVQQKVKDSPPVATQERTPASAITVLDHLDLSKRLSSDSYSSQLDEMQARLNRLTWKARDQKRSTVAVFEGWDASGKGGAIRRVTAAIDARLYQTISIAAPTDEEHAHHYLWRFWRHIPPAGYVTLYDRSWYGRVLVERVEEFTPRHAWMRAYNEINLFEQQLTEHGIILLKFWIHISADEQLRRFEERQNTPWKAHKITDEDWRNREKWDLYNEAVNDMVARTSTENAQWTIVPGNDKKFARVEVLKTFCNTLEEQLD